MPYIRGTPISLDSTAYAFREGCSPESIREDFDGLSLAQVYGVVAYYLDRQVDCDAYLARRREQCVELKRQGTPPNARLKALIDRARQGV